MYIQTARCDGMILLYILYVYIIITLMAYKWIATLCKELGHGVLGMHSIIVYKAHTHIVIVMSQLAHMHLHYIIIINDCRNILSARIYRCA